MGVGTGTRFGAPSIFVLPCRFPYVRSLMLSGRGERPLPSFPLARTSAGKSPVVVIARKLLYEPCTRRAIREPRIIKNSGSSKRSGMLGRFRLRLSDRVRVSVGRTTWENSGKETLSRLSDGSRKHRARLLRIVSRSGFRCADSDRSGFPDKMTRRVSAIALRSIFPDRVRHSSPEGKPKNGRPARYSIYLAYICTDL